MKKAVLMLSIVGTMLLPGMAGATVINVDKTEDVFELGDSGCSLRNAFISADTDMKQGDCETGFGDDVIRLPAGTYRLDRTGANESGGILGDLDMLEAPSITFEPSTRSAKVVIDGNGTDRIFDHDHANAGPLTIRNIELTNGNPGTGADGGLIRVSTGTVRLEGVTLSNGSAVQGGAVRVGGGTLEAINSTFSGNRATGSGGAINSNSGSTVDLRSVTITGNEADLDANATGDGGGVAFAGNASMTNSILAGNVDSSPLAGDKYPDCASGPAFFPRFVISSQDLGAGNCLTGFEPGSNRDPVSLALGALADNDGPTRTVAIAPGNPAIDAGGSADPDKCPEEDQRGVPRPAGQCDLGAFEYDPDGVPPDHLPGLDKPTLSAAVFDGSKLTLLVKCPGKYKPKCQSKIQARKSKNGPVISSSATVKIKPGKTGSVKLTVKPAFIDLVDSMTYLDQRLLAVSHQIRSKKVGRKKAKKPAKINLSLKVRIKN